LRKGFAQKRDIPAMMLSPVLVAHLFAAIFLQKKRKAGETH
jgi:hypothetical protein